MHLRSSRFVRLSLVSGHFTSAETSLRFQPLPPLDGFYPEMPNLPPLPPLEIQPRRFRPSHSRTPSLNDDFGQHEVSMPTRSGSWASLEHALPTLSPLPFPVENSYPRTFEMDMDFYPQRPPSPSLRRSASTVSHDYAQNWDTGSSMLPSRSRKSSLSGFNDDNAYHETYMNSGYGASQGSLPTHAHTAPSQQHRRDRPPNKFASLSSSLLPANTPLGLSTSSSGNLRNLPSLPPLPPLSLSRNSNSSSYYSSFLATPSTTPSTYPPTPVSAFGRPPSPVNQFSASKGSGSLKRGLSRSGNFGLARFEGSGYYE